MQRIVRQHQQTLDWPDMTQSPKTVFCIARQQTIERLLAHWPQSPTKQITAAVVTAMSEAKQVVLSTLCPTMNRPLPLRFISACTLRMAVVLLQRQSVAALRVTVIRSSAAAHPNSTNSPPHLSTYVLLIHSSPMISNPRSSQPSLLFVSNSFFRLKRSASPSSARQCRSSDL